MIVHEKALKQKAIFLFLTFSICQNAFSKAKDQNSFVMATHTRPPINEILNEIYQVIFKELGKPLKFLKQYPGKRVLLDTNTGSLDGDASRIRGIKAIAPNTENYRLVDEPIIRVQLVVVTKKGVTFKNIDWNNINSGRVAYIRGSMRIRKNVVEKNRLPCTRLNCFKLLHIGRVKSVVMFKRMAVKTLEKDGIDAEKLVIHPKPLMEFDLYPFVHKKHANHIPKMEKLIREIKAKGIYGQILAKYE